jgi:hypothetical protein
MKNTYNYTIGMEHIGLISSSSSNHTSHILNLPIALNKTIAEYIWIGGNNNDLHSKTRILNFKI